jgi:RND family efflux transporter MFP subunit
MMPCFSTRIFAFVAIRKLTGFVVFLLIYCPGVQAQQAALVSVDNVIQQQFTQTVPVLGRLVAKRSGSIASRIHGAISEVLVELGDEVQTGQVLAKIDAMDLDLRRQQAQSQLVESQSRLKTAKAQLALATQEVKRLEGLTNSAAVSKAVYDDARQQQNIAFARANEAEASINSSKANLEITNLDLSYAEIKAPFNGTITEKLTEVGNYLQPGQSVFEIISDKNLELEADIPASLLSGLSKTADVKVELENGSEHTARLRAIIPEENPRTRTRRVRFITTLGQDAGVLATAQSATVHVPAAPVRQIISVHKDGVIRRGENNIVYIVATGEDDATIAELRTIQTGAAVGGRVEVIDGISEGDQVVIRGNERLQPGQAIQAAPAQ